MWVCSKINEKIENSVGKQHDLWRCILEGLKAT